MEGYLHSLHSLIHSNPDVDIFAGGIRSIDNGLFYSNRHALGGDMRWFWNTKLLMGSNFTVRRKVFEELAKFDDRFGAGAPFGSSEETDFAWKAFFKGKKMLYVPNLVVFHVPPYAGPLQSEVEKSKRYGIGKGALVRKWLFMRQGASFQWRPLLELMEMTLVPLLRILLAAFRMRWGDCRIQSAALLGRIHGLFIRI
jgi:GT2 family glycosyltransferase